MPCSPLGSGRSSPRARSTSSWVSSSARISFARTRASARASASISRASASSTVALLELLARGARPAPGGLPPVDAHLARPVDRGDEQPQLDRQQLDVEQVDLDVPGDDDAL